MSDVDNPVRVMVWATLRTCSSALLKSLSNLPDSQVIFEIYTTAFYNGPERFDPNTNILIEEPVSTAVKVGGDGLIKGPGSGFPGSICSYDWARRQLEADYPGKAVIVAKEIAPWLRGRYKDIPRGYRHVFLIRHPTKMFPSWKKLDRDFLELERGVKVELEDFELDQLPPLLVPPGLTYKEIFDLWQFVKDGNLDPDPIVVDSDDLVCNPAQVLLSLCEHLGIPYTDSLLSWQQGTECVKDWLVDSRLKHIIENMAFFHNFRESTCFLKPETVSKVSDVASLSADLQRCINLSMPYYSKMYEQRLKY
ncbi:uncharacterized protein LOC119719103 [Patiria miniata]|uniref:Sulfotransferase family protein n=1 Tax=Patiria miniata TaxID=46514 RepID=A0A913YXT3_PATMI|nr:uncharacterized protein LOC119719103 [Patiria miniata]XP_038044348.1 uncharacterized protein LOC119719103 [Patiria miniata]